MAEFTHTGHVAAPADAIWRWWSRPGAIARLAPPWQRVEIVRAPLWLDENVEAELRVRTPVGRRTWLARHHDVVPGVRFTDTQVRGPFRHWVHHHTLTPDGPHATVVRDDVQYALPGGVIGAWLGGGAVRRELERTFAWRQARLAADLTDTAHLLARPLRVAVTGASGLVGRRLVARLTTLGHTVLRLVRRAPRTPDEVRWEPGNPAMTLPALEGLDALVHLAGAGVADGRWTARRRQRIRDSRVAATTHLVAALGRLRTPPRVLVQASAVGWYGHVPDRVVTEEDPVATGFLAEVCRDWEAASRPLAAIGTRVVRLRIGVVLAGDGGALARMVPPFRFGLGGVLGNGRQPVPWIAADDLVEIAMRALTDERLVGAVNAVAPAQDTNRDLTRTLGRVLRRPTIAPVPGFAVRALFGAMGQALLLEGAHVLPTKLQVCAHRFRFRSLESALRFELGRMLPRTPAGAVPRRERAATIASHCASP